mmetsp:Transcript_6618/g.7608  ORF Transcript_6618/g.7608 Transcript_6618/m.7608 type:complete len:80 (-) Transcript_6618:668-907(-)
MGIRAKPSFERLIMRPKFRTEMKLSKDGNKSMNKFITAIWGNFKSVVWRNTLRTRPETDTDTESSLKEKKFTGKDVKHF